jgi:Fe2+ or Zn2+ uptake regulation protein
MANHQLTRRQKKIIGAMKQGAILWHPYIRASSSFAYLVSEDINKQVKYSTVDKLIDLGIIEEIEDENSDVNYRLKQ